MLPCRQDLAGIKKHVKSDIVGTPLPPNRFDPRPWPRVLLAKSAAKPAPRAMQEDDGEGDQPEWRWVENFKQHTAHQGQHGF